MSFQDKTVIVAGGGRGIGRAISHRFAQAGARIVVADSDDDGGSQVAIELNSAGFEAHYIHCNVAERLDVLNLMASSLENYQTIDVMINAAAIRDNVPYEELSQEEFDQVLAVNLRGSFLLGKATAKQMIRQVQDGQTPGSMIFITSVHAILAEPNSVAFSVASGGVNQLIKAMAQALASYNIRVNGIGPSNVMTPMLAHVAKNEKSRDRALERAPLGRFGSPPEIAAIAAFLASEDASYLTGQTIYADGGLLSMRRSNPFDIDREEETAS